MDPPKEEPPVSPKTLNQNLLAADDNGGRRFQDQVLGLQELLDKAKADDNRRRRLQDQVLGLQELLYKANADIDQSKADARKSALDIRMRIQEKLALAAELSALKIHHEKLEKRHAMYESNVDGSVKDKPSLEVLGVEYVCLKDRCAELEEKRAHCERRFKGMCTAYDKLDKENDELRLRLQEKPSVASLTVDFQSLKEEKENLRINLQIAEEELKRLREENEFYKQENSRLLKQLKEQKQQQESVNESTSTAAAK